MGFALARMSLSAETIRVCLYSTTAGVGHPGRAGWILVIADSVRGRAPLADLHGAALKRSAFGDLDSPVGDTEMGVLRADLQTQIS